MSGCVSFLKICHGWSSRVDNTFWINTKWSLAVVSLWSLVKKLDYLVVWSDVWSKGIRQLGIVMQFPASSDAEGDFYSTRHLRNKALNAMHIVVFKNIPIPKCKASKCQHFSLRWCHGMGWEDQRVFTQEWHWHTTAPLLFFSSLCPSRKNPKMSPNTTSHLLDLWRGFRKCLMVNKQYANDSICILVHVCHFNCK